MSATGGVPPGVDPVPISWSDIKRIPSEMKKDLVDPAVKELKEVRWGKPSAIFKLSGGAVLVVGGAGYSAMDDTNGPVMLGTGIVLIHEGALQAILEWGFDVDTTFMASDWITIWDIYKGTQKACNE